MELSTEQASIVRFFSDIPTKDEIFNEQNADMRRALKAHRLFYGYVGTILDELFGGRPNTLLDLPDKQLEVATTYAEVYFSYYRVIQFGWDWIHPVIEPWIGAALERYPELLPVGQSPGGLLKLGVIQDVQLRFKPFEEKYHRWTPKEARKKERAITTIEKLELKTQLTKPEQAKLSRAQTLLKKDRAKCGLIIHIESFAIAAADAQSKGRQPGRAKLRELLKAYRKAKAKEHAMIQTNVLSKKAPGTGYEWRRGQMYRTDKTGGTAKHPYFESG